MDIKEFSKPLEPLDFLGSLEISENVGFVCVNFGRRNTNTKTLGAHGPLICAWHHISLA